MRNSTTFKKGHITSDETRLKMSIAHKGKKGTNLGRKFSKEWKLKISESLKGRKNPNANPPHFSGDRASHWLGDKVGYQGIHIRIRKSLGKPKKCENCGKEKTTAKSIHWANVSQKYLLDKSDWVQLCASCHKRYDLKKSTSFIKHF